MQRRTLAANRVISQLSVYQKDANQDPAVARDDPVPAMLQSLTSENFFRFMDQLNQAPRVRAVLLGVARAELCVLLDYSRELLLLGADELSPGMEQYCYPDAVPPNDIEMFPGPSLLSRCVDRAKFQEKRLIEAVKHQRANGLELTQRTRKPIGQHICHLCSLILPSNRSLAHHWLQFHPEFEPWVCRKCEQVFRSDETLRQHSFEHLEFACDQCPATYKSQTGLQRHLQQHLPDAVGELSCEFCGFKTSGARSLVQHHTLHPEARGHRRPKLRRVRSKAEFAPEPVGTEELVVRIDLAPEAYEQYQRESERRIRQAQLFHEQEFELSKMSLGLAKTVLRNWGMSDYAQADLQRPEALDLVRKMSEYRVSGRAPEENPLKKVDPYWRQPELSPF